MSYQHIQNLYKIKDTIFLFKEVYASEKIDGTSAHISWRNGQLHFSAGGASQTVFEALFDKDVLRAGFEAIGVPEVTIFGEAYGGKLQGRSAMYGKELRFVAFEVKIGDSWLNMPNAEQVARNLGLDFVPYRVIPTTIEALDAEKLRDSEQAVKCGMGTGHKREGIVLRPLIELTMNNGERVVAKHKRDDFSEVKTPRPLDVDKLEVLTEANAIAEEWVTEERLTHVLDAFPNPTIELTGKVLRAMVEDVERESAGEAVLSKEARSAISRKAGAMFKARITKL